MGISFRTVEVKFPELTTKEAPRLSPEELARHNAVGKAESVRSRYPNRVILAADTVVALGTSIFEKPVDRDQARFFLRELSGKTHVVITSLALAHQKVGLINRSTTTRVKFRRLSEAKIEKYLSKVEVLDKAGGYAIQQHGDWLIEEITGSISNVIGLPVETLSDLLRVYRQKQPNAILATKHSA